MSSPVVAFQPRRGTRLLRPNAPPLLAEEAYERGIRVRIGLTWLLLFINVLTFYKGTWNGLPLIVPIPSIIGKLITHGATRDEALARMRVALSEMRVEGIRTNIALHLDLLDDGGFRGGGVDIHHLERLLAHRR